MNAAALPLPALLDWGWAGAGLHGGESGDLQVVVLLPHGALVAVIDGLGHGPEAALAARTAAEVLRREPSQPLQELIQRCHGALDKTRGVVMSLASFDSRSSTIDWCGVGNVEGVLLRGSAHGGQRPAAIITRGGVVGYRLPSIRVSTVPVSPGDVLVMVTDGILSSFAKAIDVELEPGAIADSVFIRCASGTDDALVLAVRYRGSSA